MRRVLIENARRKSRLKRGGGRRYYRPDDITLLRKIANLLYTQGYTIKGVQRLLREGGGRLADDIPPPPPDEIADPEREGMAAGAVTMDAEPQLPMPGLETPPPPTKTTRPARVIRPADADEVGRLRGLLAHALAELQAIRVLLRTSA